MTTPWVRRRRRVLAATALPALLCLLLAVKMLSLPLLTSQAGRAHGSGDGGGVQSAGSRLGIVNVVERWRAPYVEGTGRSMSGDLGGGRSLLETALARTSQPEDDCTVRTNLVLTVEQQADAAGESGDDEAQRSLAQEALALIDDGPEGCLDGTADGNGGEAGERQRDAQQRLEETTRAQGEEERDEEEDDPAEPEQPEEQQQEDPEAQRRAEELQRRNSAGQAEAESQQNLDEARRSHDGRYAEKPW